MKAALIVIDIQNGFVNTVVKTIVPGIEQLVQKFKDSGQDVVFTKFINKPDSAFVRLVGWNEMMTQPEVDLLPEIKKYADVSNTFIKHTYGSLTGEVVSFLRKNDITTLYLCGTATNYCVLKTALDAFDKNYDVFVIEDLCASHSSDSMGWHDKALSILKKSIGKQQVINSQDIQL